MVVTGYDATTCDSTPTCAYIISIGGDAAASSSSTVITWVEVIELPRDPEPRFDYPVRYRKPHNKFVPKRFFMHKTAMSRAQIRREKRKGWLHD